MSQENVETDRQAGAAFDRRDFDAWLAHFDPEVVWYAVADEPEPGPFRGHQGIMELVARWLDLLPDLRQEVEEYIDAGEYVIVPARVRGHTVGSDADVIVDEVFVNKYRNGKIVEVREYRTREEAFAAVGLSEQDAHADS
jgi:ketosteroid isomerase-like protein